MRKCPDLNFTMVKFFGIFNKYNQSTEDSRSQLSLPEFCNLIKSQKKNKKFR